MNTKFEMNHLGEVWGIYQEGNKQPIQVYLAEDVETLAGTIQNVFDQLRERMNFELEKKGLIIVCDKLMTLAEAEGRE
jgi:hypothetical protein